MQEKCYILNHLIEPFGFSYVPSQDLFTSRVDAWQKKYGYRTLYDKAAHRFGMIYDCLPVYFNYRGRTWLIEFWKGQYGINTGCEIGVYYADRIIPEVKRSSTLFHSVEPVDMPRLSFCFMREDKRMSHLCARHWWLTAFHMGCFSEPARLSLRVFLAFPSAEMAKAFVGGLREAGYQSSEIEVYCNRVAFSFRHSVPVKGCFRRLRVKMAQQKNRILCRLFLTATKPFCLSVDRVLFLYYYLPFAFRKLFCKRRMT